MTIPLFSTSILSSGQYLNSTVNELISQAPGFMSYINTCNNIYALIASLDVCFDSSSNDLTI